MPGLGQDKSLVWVEGDAEALKFEDNSMDGYTIAFGIRNVTHIEKALAEAYRLPLILCIAFLTLLHNPVSLSHTTLFYIFIYMHISLCIEFSCFYRNDHLFIYLFVCWELGV